MQPDEHGGSAGDPTLVWRGECCIDTVQDRRAELIELGSAGRRCRLDLGAVTRIDAAGLQLIAAFAIEQRRLGHRPRWVAVSQVVHEAAQLAGLTAELGLASDA